MVALEPLGFDLAVSRKFTTALICCLEGKMLVGGANKRIHDK